MKHLTPYIAVHKDSVVPLETTFDCNDQGYYARPSVNRTLKAGQDPNGTWYLWLEGNGGPALLTDENHLEVLHDLGDAPEYDVQIGYGRLARAIEDLAAMAGSDKIEYWLDWKIQAEYLINGRTDADA